MDPSALAGADYRTTIQISNLSDPYGSTISVPVTARVDERKPELDVVPNSLRLDLRDQGDTLFVRNIGGGGRFPLPFRCSAKAHGWLKSLRTGGW